MKRKGIFTIIAAVFMVLAFSAVTFAANQVVLKTTVPNIPKSECYQAGTDTMEFDSLSKVQEGDVIQFTLNNKVTVCKSLNMWLRITTDGGALDTAADAPVATTAGTYTVSAGTGEWGFLIQATNADTAAGQIITLTVRVRDAATNTLMPLTLYPGRTFTFNGTALTDRLIVKLFDGKIVGTNSSFWKPLALTPTVYDTAIISTDNVLCIDTLTQNYTDEYVQNTPDSLPLVVANKLNFSGDYRIAHIMMEQTYNVYTCKGAVAGHISMPSTTQTACVAFDFETVAGYCADHVASKFILQSSQAFELTNYVWTMDILVNGVAGDHGVYWSNTNVGLGAYSTSGLACVGAGLVTPGQTYLRADGITAAIPVAPIAACNVVATAAKAVRLTTTASNMGIVFGSSLFLYVDFPQFNWNLSEVTAGDVVSVRLSLSKSTCGVVGTWTIPVGTFGCSGSTCTLLFPYFTSLTADAYWNGIAVINTGATAGTSTFTAYQKNGSVGTVASVPVAARGMYVNLLESMPWTGTGLGGQQAYISVSSDFVCDGFGMMAKPGTGESMGYLPRK